MAFKDKFKAFTDKVSESAKGIGESAKGLAEKSKIKGEIGQLEKDISALYLNIGKSYFESHQNETEGEYAESISEIKKKSARAEQFKQLLAALDTKQICTKCGAEVSKEQKFCDKCGEKIEPIPVPIIEGYNDAPEPEVVQPVVEEAAPVKRHCTNCGAELEAGAAFCEQCGFKVSE